MSRRHPDPRQASMESALRSALRAAADSVEPAPDGLDRIRAKISARHQARHATWQSITAAVGAAPARLAEYHPLVAGPVIPGIAVDGQSGGSRPGADRIAVRPGTCAVIVAVGSGDAAGRLANAVHVLADVTAIDIAVG